MTDARKFDELVSWHAKPVAGVGMGWDPGWRADGGAFAPNISPSDPYWNTVLDKAQAAYGDPGMRFNTSDPSADRYLVFSDGTRVPTDGSLAYRDNGNTYVMNNDGSVSLLGGDGKAGQPFFPEFRRNEAGQYVPVNAQGQQVAPLAASYVDDPATGKRTYYNANGDVVGSEQRPATPPPGSQPGVATDEQQSGRTADAVRKLHDEMKDRYSQLSEAEGKLTEAMLSARTTTAEGQQKLNDIQQKIVDVAHSPRDRILTGLWDDQTHSDRRLDTAVDVDVPAGVLREGELCHRLVRFGPGEVGQAGCGQCHADTGNAKRHRDSLSSLGNPFRLGELVVAQR